MWQNAITCILLGVFLVDAFLSKYLTNLYNTQSAQHGACPHTAVAHASRDPAMNTMNIAMPDLSAEYWCTFCPEKKSVVFRVKFPSWAVYTALTAYDSHGFPIASVNSRQAMRDPKSKASTSVDGAFVVNLMRGVEWSGPLCFLFRVYRPPGIDICPHEDLPEVRVALRRGGVGRL